MTESSHSPAIESPCERICVVHPLYGLCIGCGRSLQEIGSWVSMSPQRRAEVMAALPARIARLAALDPDCGAAAEPE